MESAKHITLERYRGGRTLNVPIVSDSGLIGISECARLLGIKSGNTMNDYLKRLSFYGQDFLNWNEVRELLQMQIFLGMKPGENSKSMYLFLRNQNQLATLFQQKSINVEAELTRLRNEYYQRQAH